MKAQILASLGETELGCAARVKAALAANDRAKYFLSLLQTAMMRADRPELPAATLKPERLACGIDDSSLDEVANGTRREGQGYRIPACAKILSGITQELRIMTAAAAEEPSFTHRLEKLAACLTAPENDLIEAETIHGITRVGGPKQDTVHQLVMDLHKRLNAMQAELAEERLEGAAAYRIEKSDRPLIAAFMAG